MIYIEASEKKAVPDMKQQTFSDFEYSNRKRKTKRGARGIERDCSKIGIKFKKRKAYGSRNPELLR